MKLKLDENIGRGSADILRDEGHDVSSVHEQGLLGIADGALFEVCKREARALVTLDRDFGQTLRYPLAKSPGVAILELGSRPSKAALNERLRELAVLLRTGNLAGFLWIVEPRRVRIHLPPD